MNRPLTDRRGNPREKKRELPERLLREFQRHYRRELLSRQELDAGPSSGGDVREGLREAHLLDDGGGIPFLSHSWFDPGMTGI